MATDDLFLTVHPESARQGVAVEKQKHALVRESILRNLRMHGPMTFSQLGVAVEAELQGAFSGSVLWYCTAVKLDLEARGEIRRIPNSRPQMIEIA